MYKPRVNWQKVAGSYSWWCRGLSCLGMGDTIEEAWIKWRAEMYNKAR